MNRAYRIIWNHAKQPWVAVSEISKSHGKSKSQVSSIKPNRHTVSILLAGTLGLSSQSVLAVNTTWTNTGTTGDWATTTNWDTGNEPTSSDLTIINNGGTANVSNTGEQTHYLRIGDGSGNNGTLSINGGTLTSAASYIGVNSSTGSVSVVGPTSSWTTGNLFLGGVFGLGTGSGTLNIGIGASVNSTSAEIGAGAAGSSGTVTVDADASWTLSANLTVGSYSNGSLTITNAGSVSNVNGYIGANTGGVGTVTVDGAQVGTASWTNSGDLFVGSSSGTGTLNIRNGGIVNVTGTTYIGSGSATGILNIGAAQGDTATGAGTLNAAAVTFGSGTGALVFNHTDTGYNFSQDITGNGSIGLFGGTTRFTGDLSGHTGTLTLDGGTLSIADGDTLTLGGNYSQTSGTLRLGASSNSSYGKLAVTGTATFAADSAIDIDVSAANTLANGALTAVVSAGTLSASTFNLTDNSALFDFTATINGNQVDLTAQKTANIVDSVTNTGFDAGTDAAQVLDDISSGSPTGDMQNVVTALGQLENDQQISDAVADTLPLLVSGTTPVITNNMHNTNRVIQARQTQTDLSGKSSGEGFITDKHLWLKPIGSWSKQQKRNGVSGYDADSYGVIGGIDGELNDSTTLGFAVSYINTDVEGKGNASGNRADIDAYQAIVYGSHDLANNNIELNWQADVGINKNEGKRHISFMNRAAKADYDSYSAHIGVGAAKSITVNDTTTVVPSIRADYAHIRTESYDEAGAGALNLDVDSNDTDELIVGIAANLSHSVNDKTTLIANAGLAYDLINDNTSITSSYAGGGAAFTTEGIDPSPWIVSAGAGVSYQLNDLTSITAQYDVEGREDFLNQTASVKVRWAF